MRGKGRSRRRLDVLLLHSLHAAVDSISIKNKNKNRTRWTSTNRPHLGGRVIVERPKQGGISSQPVDPVLSRTSCRQQLRARCEVHSPKQRAARDRERCCVLECGAQVHVRVGQPLRDATVWGDFFLVQNAVMLPRCAFAGVQA